MCSNVPPRSASNGDDFQIFCRVAVVSFEKFCLGFLKCWFESGFLLLFCTLASFSGAIAIEKLPEKKRKIALFATISVMFAVLFFYKYANFSIELISSLLSFFGAEAPKTHFDIVLPVGISFFTFQAVGYVVDVWRREITAERNFIKYALFVSFFPQLVAGPIERSKNLLRELDSPRKFDFDNARNGIFLIIWGLFLKLVIADRAAIFVDNAYAGAYSASS